MEHLMNKVPGIYFMYPSGKEPKTSICKEQAKLGKVIGRTLHLIFFLLLLV